MNDRDHFAAAALTGIVRTLPAGSIYYSDVVARQAYGLADDMLRERVKTSAEKTSGRGSVTLTDAEREAIGMALAVMAGTSCPQVMATVRGLLERTA